ncbi:DNA repair protein RecO [Paracoccus sp. (in: a-proteobacteria)]|uniref:DNA repair protein RecO n=1 Tax=Paracoccus sp. TaxID=267 RepID=UPI002899FD03|nr:DNA repair protein RecO [Paracoccus sp. (in: a-proteobacteria)]
MEWSGEATVIRTRKHGENAVILTAFARDIGLISGILPGGASAKRAAMIQPGSLLALRWRARIEGQLGTFSAEPSRARPGLLGNALALDGVNAVSALIAFALPEHDPHPRLHEATDALLDRMDQDIPWAHAYLAWELLILDELGFGLDLGACAVTGTREGLAFVSPRTGRAVSREGAGPWIDRLLPLPRLLGGTGNGGMADAFALTGHFLRAHLAESHAARPLPPARDRLIARLLSQHPD